MKNNTSRLYIITILTCLGIMACKKEPKEDVAVIEESVPGINLTHMDTLVNPGNDFFNYANGTWLKNTEIPADRSRWGSFDELRQNTDEDVLAILQAAMTDNKDVNSINIAPGSDQQKAIFLYKSILDTTARNKQGILPIKPQLEKIAEIKSAEDLQKYLITAEPNGGGGFFSFHVAPHAKNSNINAAYIAPGALGLPDRDYYVKDDADSKEKRAAYVSHITRMLQFLGETEADANTQAQQILAFETRLAEPRMDKVDRRDARKRYNPKSIAELQNLVPAINWEAYFNGIGAKNLDTVIVNDPNYMKALQNILKANNVDDWKAYLKWTAFNNATGTLSSEIEKANWDFYDKTLQGAKKQRPITERALQTLNWSIGEALGKLYVDEKFPPEAKAKAEEMIKNVIKAYEKRILKLSWMSEETKQKAIEKLNALKVKIAYPDKWEDYSELKIKSPEEGGTYYENMQQIAQWNFNDALNKLGKPVDKSEWHMAPQIVNAYFNPSFNEIVFPAAILQPPFYNYTADDAVNYGGIGAVIGHEISHSFDDSGARYDKDGNLNNWWTDEDLKQFEALGKDLADQYSNVEVLPGVTINGAFTLGENIGDLGGVNAAYDAMQMSFEKNGRPENIDGLTPEQRFFLSWATVWRTKSREDALNNQIKTDPHSPGMTRSTQPLLNVQAFYDAFNIKETDSLYIAPENRVLIW